MSCSVSLVPFLLLGSLVSSVITGTQSLANAVKDGNIKDKLSLHLTDTQMEELFNKKFQTQIMDKRTLLKTLTEHGVENIKIEGNDISCDCENFHLKFISQMKQPYSLVITYNDESGMNELVGDIGSEYTVNAQEVSYNKIKERLANKNMQIADEEICDDDTIVLTVNLD